MYKQYVPQGFSRSFISKKMKSTSGAAEILQALKLEEKQDPFKFVYLCYSLDGTMFMDMDYENTGKNFISIVADDDYESGSSVCDPLTAFPGKVPKTSNFGLPLKRLCFTNQTVMASKVLFDITQNAMSQQIKNINALLEKIKKIDSENLSPTIMKGLSEQFFFENFYTSVPEKGADKFFASLSDTDGRQGWSAKITLLYGLGYYLRALLCIILYGMQTYISCRTNKIFIELLTVLMKALCFYCQYDQIYCFQLHFTLQQYILELQMAIFKYISFKDMTIEMKEQFSHLVYHSQNVLPALQSEILGLNEQEDDENQEVLSIPKQKVLEPKDITQMINKGKSETIFTGIGEFLKLSKENVDILSASSQQSNINNSFYIISTFADQLQPFAFRALVTISLYMQLMLNCNIEHILQSIIDEDDKSCMSPQQLHAAIRQECLRAFKVQDTTITQLYNQYKSDIQSVKTINDAEKYILSKISKSLNNLYMTDDELKLSDAFIGTNILLIESQFKQQFQQLQNRIETLEPLQKSLSAFVARSSELSAIVDIQQTDGDVKTAQHQIEYSISYQHDFQKYFCSLLTDDNIFYNNFFIQMLRKEKTIDLPLQGIILNDFQAVFATESKELKPLNIEQIKELKDCFVLISNKNTNEILEVIPAFQQNDFIVPLVKLQKYIELNEKTFQLKSDLIAQTYRQKQIFFDKDQLDASGEQQLLFQITRLLFPNELSKSVKILAQTNSFNVNRLEKLLSSVDYCQIRSMGDSQVVAVSPSFYYPFAFSVEKEIQQLHICSGMITEIYKDYLPKYIVDEQVLAVLQSHEAGSEKVKKAITTYFDSDNQKERLSNAEKFLNQIYEYYIKESKDQFLIQLREGKLQQDNYIYTYDKRNSYFVYQLIIAVQGDNANTQ